MVTQKRKKIWAVELAILEKFDQVCKKHHLTYYAFFGTLLGAVRHQGFIPWDDDIDVAMFRDDYEKFQEIAPQEFSDPYFFQSSYNDRMIWPLSKIRNSRTTAVEFMDTQLNQGIFIDIFPLDDAPDGNNPVLDNICKIQSLIWRTVVEPDAVSESMKQGKPFILSQDVLSDLLNMDARKRFKMFESFNLSHFGQSTLANFIMYEITNQSIRPFPKAWFAKTEYLPFENIMIPVPAEFDKLLTHLYGDYREMVRGGSDHENIIFEPEIPYAEYLQNTDPAVLKTMLERGALS